MDGNMHKNEQYITAAHDTSRDPHFRTAKEMRSFDLSQPLYYSSTKRIKGRVYFWAPGSGPTLHSRDVTDIHGDRADFASGKEVRCHFL